MAARERAKRNANGEGGVYRRTDGRWEGKFFVDTPELDEIVRDGARQMLAAALRAEVAAYIEQFADQCDENGRRLVARNGYHQQREVMTAAGAVTVSAPRVNDRRVDPDTGERQRFSSAILPAWARKSPQISEVLPLLYLHGLSCGDFGPGGSRGASNRMFSASVGVRICVRAAAREVCGVHSASSCFWPTWAVSLSL
jgi:Transposase, Mutator family